MRAGITPEVGRHAEAVIQKYSTSYALAARLFPTDIREATYVLYAFFRESDDLVDTGEQSSARGRIDEREKHWLDVYEGKAADDGIIGAAALVFHEFGIPYQVATDFFAAMRRDTEKRGYETRAELYVYARGAAGTVGIAMAHVIGYKGDEALVYADKMGAAVQVTNILRDICEDYDELGRIYIPAVDLERYSVTEDEIRNHQVTPAFKYLMHDLVAYNRSLYAEAVSGIELLNRRGRLPVRLAVQISLGTLAAIDRNEYDIFTKRARVPTWKKGALLLSAAASEGLARLRF